MKIAIYVAALTLVAPAALGQSTTWHGVANPTFSSTSTLVRPDIGSIGVRASC